MTADPTTSDAGSGTPSETDAEKLREENAALRRELKEMHGKLCLAVRHRESVLQSFTFRIVEEIVRTSCLPWRQRLAMPWRLMKLFADRFFRGKKMLVVSYPPLPALFAKSAAEGESETEFVAPAVLPRRFPAPLTAVELPSENLPAGFSIGSLRKAGSDEKPAVVSIADEFTSDCLKYDVMLSCPGLEHWEELLDYRKPDFFLMESCWRGNGNRWGALTHDGPCRPKLEKFLELCRRRGIPSVIWNKEDPPHFDRFLKIARLFDFVFTSDELCVRKYEKAGITAVPLTFAAQPFFHNPLPVIPRLPKAVFAGTYYSYRNQRCEDFRNVTDLLEATGLDYDIFDRCADYDPMARLRFSYPERYASKIAGSLPPEEMWRAHKGYRFTINMNTVKHSPTMFARRVFESLASGTPVISNDSLGMTQLFGDIVLSHGNGTDATDRLRHLLSDENAYRETAAGGVRAVMREHTYNHRIKFIADTIGLPLVYKLRPVDLTVRTRGESEVREAVAGFRNQTCPSGRLQIIMDGFEPSESLRNETSERIVLCSSKHHDDSDDNMRQNGREVRLEDLRKNRIVEDILYGLEGSP